jgi:hypothetical protein
MNRAQKSNEERERACKKGEKRRRKEPKKGIE